MDNDKAEYRGAVAPRAIEFDGFRWHTRALFEVNEVLNDFLLSRILQMRGVEASEGTDAADVDWQQYVTLEIGIHPELFENQKKGITQDYVKKRGRERIKVRCALLYYALKHLGLDTDLDVEGPQDRQIVLFENLEVLG